MSFDSSVGDFIALGTLSWSVYRSCKEAFKVPLWAVLKEAEETVFAHPLPPEKQERLKLKAVGDGCHHVLADLDNLCKEYQSLGTQIKRNWDVALCRYRGVKSATDFERRATYDMDKVCA